MSACGNKSRIEHTAVKETSYLETRLMRVMNVSESEMKRHRSIH